MRKWTITQNKAKPSRKRSLSVEPQNCCHTSFCAILSLSLFIILHVLSFLCILSSVEVSFWVNIRCSFPRTAYRHWTATYCRILVTQSFFHFVKLSLPVFLSVLCLSLSFPFLSLVYVSTLSLSTSLSLSYYLSLHISLFPSSSLTISISLSLSLTISRFIAYQQYFVSSFHLATSLFPSSLIPNNSACSSNYTAIAEKSKKIWFLLGRFLKNLFLSFFCFYSVSSLCPLHLVS